MKSKVLLIGASSYLGARIFYDLRNDFDIVGTYSSNQFFKDFIQLDITDQLSVEKLIKEIQPDVIIHAANNGSGGWCQTHPEEAVKLNQTATQFVVDAANKIGAKLMYISSFAALNPVDVYGQTKAASEELTKKVQSGWLILRPSLIIGMSPNTTNDRPFNRYLKNIDQQSLASYDTSWNFQPTYIGHISQVIKAAINKNSWNKSIPIVIKDVTSRYQIAKDILPEFGVKVEQKDEGMNIPVVQTDPKFFTEFAISEMNYEQLISVLIEEIHHRKDFSL